MKLRLNYLFQEHEGKEDERVALIEDDENEEGQASPSKQRKPFDEAGHLKLWDEGNPEIEIPPEVIDYIDNDFDLEYDDRAE